MRKEIKRTDAEEEEEIRLLITTMLRTCYKMIPMLRHTIITRIVITPVNMMVTHEDGKTQEFNEMGIVK